MCCSRNFAPQRALYAGLAGGSEQHGGCGSPAGRYFPIGFPASGPQPGAVPLRASLCGVRLGCEHARNDGIDLAGHLDRTLKATATLKISGFFLSRSLNSRSASPWENRPKPAELLPCRLRNCPSPRPAGPSRESAYRNFMSNRVFNLPSTTTIVSEGSHEIRPLRLPTRTFRRHNRGTVQPIRIDLAGSIGRENHLRS